MKLTTILVAAFSLAFLAACDRGEPRPKMGASGSSAAPKNEASPMQNTPSSANSGKTESPPVSQQVDPKESKQHKDFKTDGK